MAAIVRYAEYAEAGQDAGKPAPALALRTALKVALPTANGGLAYPQGMGYQNGTAYYDTTNSGSASPTYKGLLAVWDAFNGNGTGIGSSGIPSDWHLGIYWTASSEGSMHVVDQIQIGFVSSTYDYESYYVALELVNPFRATATTTDTTPPPAAIGLVTDNVGAIQGALASGIYTDDTTLALSGITDPGATVKVYDGATLLSGGTVTADSSGAWSFTTAALADATAHSFNVTATDTATSPNTSAHSANFNVTIDTVAPVFTSAAAATVTPASSVEAAGATVYDANATHTVGGVTGAADVGVVYSLSGGADMGLFQIDSSSGIVSFKNAESYGSPHDVGTDHVYNFTVHAADVAGNAPTDQAVALTVAAPSSIAVYSDAAHTASVGNLIAQHYVDGASYYYWDRSGDGTNANTGSLNGSLDTMTHTDLNSIFQYDIDGVSNGGAGTTDVYRYATLYTGNGTALHVALPTVNGGLAYPNGIGTQQNGTVYTDTTNSGISSPTYKGLLAIWDAYNGSAAGSTNIAGAPTGWQGITYWSATPSASGHANVYLGMGFVYDSSDTPAYYVAVQVL